MAAFYPYQVYSPTYYAHLHDVELCSTLHYSGGDRLHTLLYQGGHHALLYQGGHWASLYRCLQ